MTFIGAAGVVIALTTDPMASARARHEKQVLKAGRSLVSAYESRGVTGLSEEAARLEREARMPAFLYKRDQGSLSGRPAPGRGEQLASTAAVTGELQVAPGRRGLWFALPLENNYVILAEVPRPTPLENMLDPRHLGLRLSVTFVVAGIVCYLLARSLTAPILHLQKAARQFAGGALETRVGPFFGRRRDEIADLGRDFDNMAGRIESLVQAQRRLLRDISHELRSPLARLNVALELARRHAGPGAEDALDRMERESERLNDLIGQLTTLTLLESGAERLDKTSFDLSLLVREVVDDADFEARSRGRSVNFVPGGDLMITASEEMLRRAVENVVRNAVRYTAEGSTVEVTLHSERKAGPERAICKVRDHGRGVPEEALSNLFRPFYRVADSRDRETGGTGIGLAITERAVRLHGGTVTASNAADGGLVVEISLPLES